MTSSQVTFQISETLFLASLFYEPSQRLTELCAYVQILSQDDLGKILQTEDRQTADKLAPLGQVLTSSPVWGLPCGRRLQIYVIPF